MNELNNALLKDLIESTNFKKNTSVRNPLNIIGMLESIPHLPIKEQEYLQKLKLKEKKFTYKSSRKVSGSISKILNNEKVFLDRFDILLSKVESITSYAFSIVDLKSTKILEHSIKSGVDINLQTNETYLLKHALESKNPIISNYLYDLPNLDKFKVDSHGNNLAHVASLSKNYNIIDKLSKEHINLFYIKNNDNKTALDMIFNYKQYDTLPNKTKLCLKECILMFIKLHHTRNNIIADETLEIFNQSLVLKNILIESNYHKLNNLLVTKKDTQIKSKVSKI